MNHNNCGGDMMSTNNYFNKVKRFFQRLKGSTLEFDLTPYNQILDKINQLKYKRYTPLTHGNTEPQIQSFKPFSKSEFLRDIMVDYARCLYKRGMATVIKKKDFAESFVK